MRSAAALGAAVAVARLSPRLNELYAEHGGLAGLAGTFETIQNDYASEVQQMVGFVMFLQPLLSSDPSVVNLWLVTAWNMAAKFVFDDGVYLADTLTVWNSPEVSDILGQRNMHEALVCEQYAFGFHLTDIEADRVRTRMHVFRSALLRVLLQEECALAMLRAPVASTHPVQNPGPLRLRALVVDADKTETELVRGVLQDSTQFTTVDTVTTAEEALFHARHTGYDLIFVDLRMLSPRQVAGEELSANDRPVGVHQAALAHALHAEANLLVHDSMLGKSCAYDCGSGMPLLLAYAREQVAEPDIETMCATSPSRDKRAFDAVLSAPFTLTGAHAALGMCWGCA
jgi:CheY-like chemotaxis protein